MASGEPLMSAIVGLLDFIYQAETGLVSMGLYIVDEVTLEGIPKS